MRTAVGSAPTSTAAVEPARVRTPVRHVADSRRLRHDGRAARVFLAIALTALVGGLAVEAAVNQRQSARESERRFQERIEVSAAYVDAHLGDMRNRQLNYAQRQLAGSGVTAASFDNAVLSFGFKAAVLLDESGRVLGVSPHRPELLGKEIASDYRHLSEALRDGAAVSGVVLSAAKREPIVAVAVAYETPTGTRVISGGYEIAKTPLNAFLASASSARGREVYLVDAAHQMVATTQSTTTHDLRADAPALAGLRPGASRVTHQGRPHVAVVAPVRDTQWRLIAIAPADELHGAGSGRALWALVAAAAALAATVLVLLGRVSRQRDHLRRVNRIDPLTGLANRAHATEVMSRVAAVSDRTRQPWAVAMVDIDRFKTINDRLGHAAGDEALRQVARVLDEQMRAYDVCARWGGEEFLVVMEGADVTAATAAAQRLAAAVRLLTSDSAAQVTLSIGVAATTGGDPEWLVAQADEALYEAKRSGRDRVVAAAAGIAIVPAPRIRL